MKAMKPLKVPFERLIVLFFLLMLILSMTGCGVMNQAFTAYGAVAVENTKTTNDNVISAWSIAACATPLSAIYRNPDIIPVLQALCAPKANALPSSLLEAAAQARSVFVSGNEQ